MTRAKIVEAAVKLWDSAGPEGFTIRKLALQLKVVPTTIRAHVKGGIGELRREVARRVLADLTRPYKPNQDPNDYLREFFRSALASFRQRPTLARLVILGKCGHMARRVRPLMEKCGHTSLLWCMVAFRLAAHWGARMKSVGIKEAKAHTSWGSSELRRMAS